MADKKKIDDDVMGLKSVVNIGPSLRPGNFIYAKDNGGNETLINLEHVALCARSKTPGCNTAIMLSMGAMLDLQLPSYEAMKALLDPRPVIEVASGKLLARGS